MANVKNNASAKETKRRLIDAAGEVFAAHGFERATIKEITDRAGASVAAVNYHFSDKQELYDQVVQHIHEQGCPVFRALSDTPADASPEERLRAFVLRLLQHVLDPAQPAWFGQIKTREMAAPSPVTDRWINDALRPFVLELEQFVATLVGHPATPVELTRLANSIVGQVLYYAHNRDLCGRLHPEQPTSVHAVDEIADHITRFTLAALSCWK